MTYQSNTSALKESFIKLKTIIDDGKIRDALFAGVNQSKGLLLRRVFTKNMSATGIALGKYYSKQHKRKREKNNLLVAKKNLQFTDSLYNSIETVAVDNVRVEIRITNTDSANIARFQEIQIAAKLSGQKGNYKATPLPIFSLSDVEIEITSDACIEFIKEAMSF